MRALLVGSAEVRFAGQPREEVYGWTARTLVRQQYASLGRAGEGFGAELHRPDEEFEPGSGEAVDHGI